MFKKKDKIEEVEVNEEEKKESFIEKTKAKYERFQLILAFIGAIYFVVTVIINLTKNFADSKLFPFILGCTILYILVFIIFLLCHKKDSKKVKYDTKRFNNNLKIVKLIMNLLFIASSALLFIESLQQLSIETSVYDLVNTGLSGLLLLVKLLSTLSKIKKTIKKNKKLKKKEQKRVAKEEAKQARLENKK